MTGEWNRNWCGRRRKACCLERRMNKRRNCRNSLCCASFTPLLSPMLIHLLLLSFSCVQVPQILSPSALIMKSPPPTLSALQSHTHSEHTAHWCNSCCLGGHRRLWVGSINVMVHTHKRSCTHMQPHHWWGPLYLPFPTEGHPAANEDTQTPLTISTTLA